MKPKAVRSFLFDIPLVEALNKATQELEVPQVLFVSRSIFANIQRCAPTLLTKVECDKLRELLKIAPPEGSEA